MWPPLYAFKWDARRLRLLHASDFDVLDRDFTGRHRACERELRPEHGVVEWRCLWIEERRELE